jgi:CubicO group peptidase (beta-lactamase class C family)
MARDPSRRGRSSVASIPAPVRDVVTAVMRRSHIPGLSLAMTSHDQLLCADAFGYASLSARLPATPRTSYLWFSMSKVVTATAALRLADEGRLDLDAPIATYVPGYANSHGSAQPRVRQLLNHTAGVANPLPLRWVRPAGDAAPDPRELLTRLLAKHGKPKYEIGGQAHYSNLGYLMLAEIVGSAAGCPFEQYVGDAVLRPAGMRHTGYRYRDGGERAIGYIRTPRAATPAVKALLPRGLVGQRHHRYLSFRPFLVDGAGYGGLVGDVVDAARLAALHLNDGSIDGHRILAVPTARRMRRVDTPGAKLDLGLAWFRKAAQRNASPAFVEHHGAGGGFYNVMRLYPELRIGMVLMANTTAAYDHDLVFDVLRQEIQL